MVRGDKSADEELCCDALLTTLETLLIARTLEAMLDTDALDGAKDEDTEDEIAACDDAGVSLEPLQPLANTSAKVSPASAPRTLFGLQKWKNG